jgi:chorismate synthase
MAAGNTFGDLYKITTYGESHGKSIGVIIDGCPSGLKLDLKKIQQELDKRQPGQSKITTQRKEDDKFEIHSGVYKGITLGTPIMIIVMNKNFDSSKYNNIRNKLRPGHADHTYQAKYEIRDANGGGRSSARETIGRVLGGAIAKQVLNQYSHIKIIGYTACVGGIEAIKRDFNFIEKNDLRCPDKTLYKSMKLKVTKAISNKDSIGGAVEIIAKNIPLGLGEPVFDKLSSNLMESLGSIGAVKGIEIGSGKQVENMLGSNYNDQIIAKKGKIIYKTNNAGGIIGGISNGEDIKLRLSVKPTPTRNEIPLNLPTQDGKKNKEVIIKGNHDPIIMPRIVPIAEAMVAITILNFLLKQKAYELFKK